MKRVVTSSFEETQKLGYDFAKDLKGGEVLALHGDLGSGKTTFVQGLAKGLGIEKRIISPTFIIMRSYVIPTEGRTEGGRLLDRGGRVEGSHTAVAPEQSGGGRFLDYARNDNKSKNFYHIDLYRIESERDVEGLGLLELMGDPENIMVIEWPEKIEHLLPENRIDLSFEYVGEDKRRIRV